MTKPWKGFVELVKPNGFRCSYCSRDNADWEASHIARGFYVHKLCFFKSSHYGMTPAEHSRWRRDYMKVRPLVLKRDQYTCQMCRNDCAVCKRDKATKGRVNLQVHHIKPVKEGGSNGMSNLLTLCAFCNQIADSIRREKNQKLAGAISRSFPLYVKEIQRAIKRIESGNT